MKLPKCLYFIASPLASVCTDTKIIYIHICFHRTRATTKCIYVHHYNIQNMYLKKSFLYESVLDYLCNRGCRRGTYETLKLLNRNQPKLLSTDKPFSSENIYRTIVVVLLIIIILLGIRRYAIDHAWHACYHSVTR